MQGLKYYRQNVKGAGLKHKLYELKWEIIYAWQRAWKGYDNSDVFNLNDNFLERMPILLKEFNKCKHGLENSILEHYTNDEDKADQVWTDVLNKIIECFQNTNEDTVKEKLYGKNYDYQKYTMNDYKRMNEFRLKNQRKAMELFTKYLDSLWD